jgi:hypothetical protein
MVFYDQAPTKSTLSSKKQGPLPINGGHDVFSLAFKRGGSGNQEFTRETVKTPYKMTPHTFTAPNELWNITNLGQQQLRSLY